MTSAVMSQVLLHMAAILAPSSDITVSQWADRHRQLSPESAAKVGQWKSYPYQVEPMDAASDPAVHRLVAVSATQMIKTSIIENATARAIDVDPLPILIVQPRREDAVDFAEERIEPMIRDTPRLQAKVYATSKKLKKLFRGGMLTIVSAGKAENAARRAIGLLCLDEIDKYRLTKEGNFLPLARKRLETYKSRAKEIDASSPTFEGSEIDKAYQASDQREYYVACPLCGKEQSMMRKFRTQVRFNSALPTMEEQALSARYHCEHCDQPWDEQARRDAVSRGRWIAKKPFRGVAGFWISALYSFSKRLDQVVLEFLQAKDNPEDLRAFVNTTLAENFADQGDTPDWQALVNRRENYAPEQCVPKGALVLTAGADVHPDRIEVELVGWGRNRRSWGIRKEIFEGRTSELRGQPGRPSPWEQLEAFMAEIYPHELGGEIICSLLFVDSGNQSNDVYQWVRTQPSARVMAIKGVERGALPVAQPSPVDVTIGGRVIRQGLRIRGIVVPFFKSELYADLKKVAPTEEQRAEGWQYPAGYCHFPIAKNYGDEHFRQLCAEQLVTTRDRRTGRTKREWQQIRARNEGLDIRIYARAAAWELGTDRFQARHWQELEWHLTADLFKRQQVPAVASDSAPAVAPQAALLPHTYAAASVPFRARRPFPRVIARLSV
jgi:phage terminase large subunit GpA-like protein